MVSLPIQIALANNATRLAHFALEVISLNVEDATKDSYSNLPLVSLDVLMENISLKELASNVMMAAPNAVVPKHAHFALPISSSMMVFVSNRKINYTLFNFKMPRCKIRKSKY